MRIKLFAIFLLFLMFSCVKETPKAHLLEFRINSRFNSYEGFACRYTEIESGVNKAYDWHVYNLGKNSLYIQAYDPTLTNLVFPFPSFQARYTVERSGGDSTIYKASSGEFRLLGKKSEDISGDFHFTLKNTENPDDSLVFTDGYFRICLEMHDRILPK
jgi:hypothetical protein